MKKRGILYFVIVLVILSIPVCAGTYSNLDPAIVDGANALSWATVVGVNDAPFNMDQTTADILYLDNTGETIPMPENAEEWETWMRSLSSDKTDGKGDFAICKVNGEDFLRAAYDLDDNAFCNYRFQIYSDGTRLFLDGLRGYIAWNMNDNTVQKGARVVYSEDTGKFTVKEFNRFAIETPEEAMVAARFGWLMYTCNYIAVSPDNGGAIDVYDAPSGGSVVAQLADGDPIAACFRCFFDKKENDASALIEYLQDGVYHFGWIRENMYKAESTRSAPRWIGVEDSKLTYPKLTNEQQVRTQPATPTPQPTAAPTPLPDSMEAAPAPDTEGVPVSPDSRNAMEQEEEWDDSQEDSSLEDDTETAEANANADQDNWGDEAEANENEDSSENDEVEAAVEETEDDGKEKDGSNKNNSEKEEDAKSDKAGLKKMKVVNVNFSVNLRAEPNAKSKVLAQLELGTEVETTGEEEAGFIKVEYEGLTGYIGKKYLK